MRVISDKFSIFLYVFLTFFLMLESCSDDDVKPARNSDGLDIDSLKKSVPTDARYQELIKLDTFPKINYQYIVIQDQTHLANIKLEYKETPENPSNNKMFCTLNRKERRFLRVGDTVLIADTIMPDMVAYSIFPLIYPSARDIKKLVIVSNAYQAYACYDMESRSDLQQQIPVRKKHKLTREDMQWYGNRNLEYLHSTVRGKCHTPGISTDFQAVHFINSICPVILLHTLVSDNFWMMQSGFTNGAKVPNTIPLI